MIIQRDEKPGRKITESFVQSRAFWALNHHEVLVPNFYAPGWFECDMLAIAKSGYWFEFEIKISLSDLRADAKKIMKDGMAKMDGKWRPIGRKKYDMLREGKGPNRFFYIVPNSMEEKAKEIIPDFAGLYIICDNYYVRKSRNAKLLHKEKADDRLRRSISSSFYHRYWRMRGQLEKIRAAKPGTEK